MMTPDTPAAQARGLGGYLTRAEAWLDSKGRGAWIAAMVLGFIFLWPIGLALVFYITFTNRWSKPMFGSTCRSARNSDRPHAHWGHHHHRGHWGHAGRPTGNAAFDAYKAETLRRLEEEQEAFETFLERLRAAKDKTEFDSFMEDRARSGTDHDDTAPPPAVAATGSVPQSY